MEHNANMDKTWKMLESQNLGGSEHASLKHKHPNLQLIKKIQLLGTTKRAKLQWL